MERVIVYIDGFNLYFGLRDKGWRRYYWLDPYRLALKLLQPQQKLVAIKYFTARISAPPSNPEKRKRQATWLEAIQLQSPVEIFYGHYLLKVQRCNNCKAAWTVAEEKMTDVNIATELLCDAYEDRFDTALLVSADSDLATPVGLVTRKFSGKRVVMVCPPKRQSKRLESVATACLRIGRKTLADSQLPDEIRKPDGFVLKRPGRWQ